MASIAYCWYSPPKPCPCPWKIISLWMMLGTAALSAPPSREEVVAKMTPYSGEFVRGVDPSSLNGKVMCGYVTDDDMPANLLTIVESTTLDDIEIKARTKQIHADVLSKSKSIDKPNFTAISPADLELLFAQYDDKFFNGKVKESLGTVPLHFGLSKRMTSSGGKTAHYTHRADGKQWYEISASTTLLFQCFAGDDHRPISNSGIICHDRLDALQRVMEHELVHLIEMLLWDKSSCAKPRFHSITRRFFGHTENKHQLITPKEKAMVKYGIKPGMQVRFRFDGIEHTGVVNRINKRATVLVEDRNGTRYSNGKHYAKFYVPVQMLEAVE